MRHGADRVSLVAGLADRRARRRCCCSTRRGVIDLRFGTRRRRSWRAVGAILLAAGLDRVSAKMPRRDPPSRCAATSSTGSSPASAPGVAAPARDRPDHPARRRSAPRRSRAARAGRLPARVGAGARARAAARRRGARLAGRRDTWLVAAGHHAAAAERAAAAAQVGAVVLRRVVWPVLLAGGGGGADLAPERGVRAAGGARRRPPERARPDRAVDPCARCGCRRRRPGRAIGAALVIGGGARLPVAQRRARAGARRDPRRARRRWSR